MKILILICLAIIGQIHSSALRDLDKALDNEPKAVYPPGTTICFDDIIGCFTNNAPWNNCNNQLPISPKDLNVEFLLYTRKNRLQEQYLKYDDTNTLKNSNFNKDLPLKILIHGFQGDKFTQWMTDLKNAILNEEDANVILVDWGQGAKFPDYDAATANSRLAGKTSGVLVNAIRDYFVPANPATLNIHCIGHSLGSHICSYASNAAKIRFNRISGMDPAGPNFENTDLVVRLDPEDADFVDAIHTNTGTSILSGTFGIVRAVGHVDFYPNGGVTQPLCPTIAEMLILILNGAPIDPTKEIGCSHSRAYELYIDSLTSHIPLLGYRCASFDSFERGECQSCAGNQCATLGYFGQFKEAKGPVYLVTRSRVPFSGEHYLFEITVNSGTAKTAGILSLSFEKYDNNVTRIDDDITPGNVLKRPFVTDHDLNGKQEFSLTFYKKPKPLLQPDPPRTFTFDKIRVTNFETRETYSYCSRNTFIEDKIPIRIQLQKNDCNV